MTTEQQAPTIITIGELFGQKKVANITIENARFWGRPNLAGELDSFKDSSRKFTVIIPYELADDLRNLGWNVKTSVKTVIGTRDDGSDIVKYIAHPSVASLAPLGLGPEVDVVSSLKVKVDMSPEKDAAGKGSKVWISTGHGPAEQLNSRTAGIVDRSRIRNVTMELRAWEYDPEDEPGKYSARLVEMIAEVELNRVAQVLNNLNRPVSTEFVPAADATP
jgi:hypothetical protein